MATDQFIASTRANLGFWSQQIAEAERTPTRRLALEWTNILRAVGSGLSFPETVPETPDLIVQAFAFVELHSHWAAWIGVLQQALAACPADQAARRLKLLDH